jgi:C4-dicarboxylate-specific signal transduction histidine kinase
LPEKLLIVEDEAIVAADLKATLERCGYGVLDPVDSGKAALAAACEHRPLLILMDIRLAGEMDGIESATRIREQLHLPVVFLTAHSDKATLLRARESAPFGFLLKPFKERELRSTIEIALHRHNLEETLRATKEELEREREDRLRAEDERDRYRVLTIRSDRLRSLGQMAAGIAHEINQPLLGVRGMAEHILISLQRGWDSNSDELKSRVENIIQQADRMEHIVEHVRMFAREGDRAASKHVDVNRVVESAAALLVAPFRQDGIRLEQSLGERLPKVNANLFSLEEVIINLLNNARDAELEKKVSRDDPTTILVRTRSLDSCVEIAVVDGGVGIPNELTDRIFEPFFTTKEPEKGTGLGLAIARNIVDDFGGKLDIVSSPGSGCTVSVTLPAVL